MNRDERADAQEKVNRFATAGAIHTDEVRGMIRAIAREQNRDYSQYDGYFEGDEWTVSRVIHRPDNLSGDPFLVADFVLARADEERADHMEVYSVRDRSFAVVRFDDLEEVDEVGGSAVRRPDALVFDGDGNRIEASVALTTDEVDGARSLLVRPVDFFARKHGGPVNEADDVQVAVPFEALRDVLASEGSVLIEWDGGYTTATSEREAETVIARKLREWAAQGSPGERSDFTVRSNRA